MSMRLAQTPQAGFNYAEKTATISLAKSGDADAFFKLGIAHLNGVGANQNDAVAQRFFFYAARKGHAEAKTYLIQAPDAAQRPALTSRAAPAKTKDVKTKNKAQKNRAEEKRLKIAERKAKRAKRQAQAKKKAKQVKANRVKKGNSGAKTVNFVKEAPTTSLDAVKEIKLNAATTDTSNKPPSTSVVRSQTIMNPNISPKTDERPALSIYIIYLLLALGGIVVFGAIQIKKILARKHRQTTFAEFKETYL